MGERSSNPADWERPSLHQDERWRAASGPPAVVQKWRDRAAARTGRGIIGDLQATQASFDRQKEFLGWFEGTEFKAFVKESRFSKLGELMIMLEIPSEDKDKALMLTDAFTIPLVFTASVLPEFMDAQEEM